MGQEHPAGALTFSFASHHDSVFLANPLEFGAAGFRVDRVPLYHPTAAGGNRARDREPAEQRRKVVIDGSERPSSRSDGMLALIPTQLGWAQMLMIA